MWILIPRAKRFNLEAFLDLGFEMGRDFEDQQIAAQWAFVWLP
jgi:hypothetical protein